jgi:hypothetical protein
METKNLPEDLSVFADHRVVCCRCKIEVASYIKKDHERTLEQIKVSN